VIDPGECGHGREPADLDVAVRGAQDEVRRELLVVQPAVTGHVEDEGGLAGDPAHLGCRKRTGREELGHAQSPVEGLLDNVGDVPVRAHIEDAAQPGVVQARDPAGGVEDRGDVVVLTVHGEQEHGPVERGVACGPLLRVRVAGSAALGGVPTTQDGPGPDPLH